MKLPGGRHEGKPAPECDEEEKMATASSLEEGPGGHLKNKHMGQIPQDRENGQNVAFFHNFWSSAVTKRFDRFNFSQLF